MTDEKLRPIRPPATLAFRFPDISHVLEGLRIQ